MDVPSDYKTVGVFMLVSGIMNTMAAGLLVVMMMMLCIGWLWIPALLLGVIEIAVGVSILQGEPRHNAQVVAILGIVSAMMTGNWISLVLEILAIVWLGKPDVKRWLDEN